MPYEAPTRELLICARARAAYADHSTSATPESSTKAFATLNRFTYLRHRDINACPMTAPCGGCVQKRQQTISAERASTPKVNRNAGREHVRALSRRHAYVTAYRHARGHGTCKK